MMSQPLVFPFSPQGQVAIQLAHRRVQRRGIKAPVVANPTPYDRVEHAGQIFDRLIAALWQVPASNFHPNGLCRFRGDCRTEIDEVFPLAIL